MRLEVRKRLRFSVGLLLGVLFSAALAAQPGGAGIPTEPLTRQVGLELDTLFNVVELEEGAGYARLRIVARAGPARVFWLLGAALGNAWVRQPVPNGGKKTVRGSTRPLGAAVYRARYLHRRSSRLLHVTLRPVGRSNLFRLELRLTPAQNAP